MTGAVVNEQAEVRRQQRLEELCAATLRALAGEPRLRFRGHRLYRGLEPLDWNAPQLRLAPGEDDFATLRGTADGMAMRLAHSDSALHRALEPTDDIERWVFELLEQYRCESLAALPGVRANLRHRHAVWSLAFHGSRLTETRTGLALYTLAQVARARVTGDPVLEATEDLIEGSRAGLVPLIGRDLAALRALRHDQRAYAAHARSVARLIAGQTDVTQLDDANRRALRGQAGGADGAAPGFALWLDRRAGDDVPVAEAADAGTRTGLAVTDGDGYRIFTAAHDREQRADAGVRPAQLREWRTRLDERVAAQGVNLPRLARELRALLARPADDGWDGAQEEGRLDGRRLAQLVANPAERRLFRSERRQPVADAAVTLLLDCSGSMKAHAEPVAVLADVLMRALEAAGARAELLGFSTGGWNGGQAARDWQRAGSPPRPGRLNERLHLVFKPFEQPWRRARQGIAALYRTEQFREGIDGEAVDWACDRLAAQAVSRRVLIVVGDGCPMDSATQRVNDATYLERHLQQVVARREAGPPWRRIEIAGFGVGLDLSPWYGRSRVVDIDGAVRNQAFVDLLALLRPGP